MLHIIGGRSSKMAEKGSAREHLAVRSRKLVCDADINISSSFPISLSMEQLNPLDGDCRGVV